MAAPDARGRRAPSVRRQLAAMLALAVMPAALLAVADGARMYAAAVRDAEQRFRDGAIVEAQRERDAFSGLRYALAALAASAPAADFGAPRCDAIMTSFDEAFPEYVLAVAIDVDGVVRCTSIPEVKGRDLGGPGSSLEAFLEDPRFSLSSVDRGRITGREVIVASTPLFEGGELRGLISVSLPVSSVRFLAPPSREGVERAVLDDDGEVLVAPTSPEGDAGWLPAPDALDLRLSGWPETFAATARDGARRVYVTAPLVEGRAWLISAAPAEMVREGLFLRALAPIAAPFLMLVIAVAVGYLAVDKLVVRHVVYLGRMTRAYGRGRLDLRPVLVEGAPREIADLADDLGAMAERLAERERELKASADSNRMLLLEVYHRVKNNLQTISSLLSLQGRRATSEVERAALARTQSRVSSMSLVHERLYASGDLERVQIDDLIRAIAGELADDPQGAARLTLDLDPVREPAERATPLGLFVNEAVVNALKHGEPGGGADSIAIRLRAGAGGGFALTIENDADPGDDAEPVRSLGWRLMEGFARQLRADFGWTRRDGRFLLELRAPPAEAPTGAPERTGAAPSDA